VFSRSSTEVAGINTASYMDNRYVGSASLGARLAAFWYSLAAPKDVAADASFKARDEVRRAKTASWILLVVMLMVIIPAFQAWGKVFVLIPLGISFAIILVAFYLNKRKHTLAAGIITVFTSEVGLLMTIFTVPGGATATNLPLFDLMLQGIIVAAYLIGPGWSFLVMVVNIVAAFGMLQFGHVSPDLHLAYVTNSSVLIQVIEVQFLAAVFSYILVKSSNVAISNLDRSEEIVSLERRELEQQQDQLTLKQQLEDGVHQLLQTHVRAANGDFTARVPLSQDNVLWRVAYSLNNLLSRLERYNQLDVEVRRTQEAVKGLAASLRAARSRRQPLQIPQRTGTMLDEVIVELTATTMGAEQQLRSTTQRSLNEQSVNKPVAPQGPQGRPVFEQSQGNTSHPLFEQTPFASPRSPFDASQVVSANPLFEKNVVQDASGVNGNSNAGRGYSIPRPKPDNER
jgi:hypothetical protein